MRMQVLKTKYPGEPARGAKQTKPKPRPKVGKRNVPKSIIQKPMESINLLPEAKK